VKALYVLLPVVGGDSLLHECTCQRQVQHTTRECFYLNLTINGQPLHSACRLSTQRVDCRFALLCVKGMGSVSEELCGKM
jgi:hypothetical protein